jgi:hypothetical protein
MSILSRFRYSILIAILVVIGLLSVAASGITLLGISSLQQISEQTGLVARTSNEAILLARINTNIQAINAALYQIVSDPRPENRRTAQAAIAKELETFKARFDALSKLVVSDQTKAKLATTICVLLLVNRIVVPPLVDSVQARAGVGAKSPAQSPDHFLPSRNSS